MLMEYSKDLDVDMRLTGLSGYVYGFFFSDYYSVDVNHILDIHKYLIKVINIK